MLPQIQVRPERPKRPKFRPINSTDTAAATGLPVNPNGTYVANTFPQGNAMFGAQGQFGSGLPQVNVSNFTPQTSLQYQTVPFANNLVRRPKTPAPFMTSQQAGQFGVTQPGIARPSGITGQPPAGYGPPRTPAPTTAGEPDFAQRQAATWQNLNNIMQNVASNPNFLSTLSPETQATVEKFLSNQQQPNPNAPFGGFQNTGGEKNTDYSQTASAQYYAATGRRFEDQERWVPGEGYVKIGKLIQQGRLDVKTGKFSPGKKNRKGNPRRGEAQQAQASAPQQNADYTLSNSFVNFNTATG